MRRPILRPAGHGISKQGPPGTLDQEDHTDETTSTKAEQPQQRDTETLIVQPGLEEWKQTVPTNHTEPDQVRPTFYQRIDPTSD